MANDKTDKDKKDESKQAGPVAELHVPQIITALHQNAISKCKSQLGSKLRLVNSAIDDSGDKSVLMSTGQHIISVMPTEEAAKAEEDVPKDVAVKVLQTYIQWFIGPDFAKEVNDKTVKSLSEAPDVNDNSKKDKDKLDEHIKPFMKFSQFLREAKTSDGDSTDFGDPEDRRSSKSEDDESSVDFGDNELEKAHPEDDDTAPDFEKAERRHDPNKKPDKDKQNDDGKKKQNDKQNDSNGTSSTELGYYVTYDLKVEGMKKPAKIDDSMKSMGKSIVNYFKNFFDNVTFTASGLFGGGQSFTVKDVKDKLRQTFGPIDPDELARNVEERINKKFKGSTPHASVDVQDRRTLVSDLGFFINGKQKQKIESAEYSLKILIDQDDPKKDILNKGAIANIVQASITGLFKKFKNRVTADDVIYIQNYRDIHTNTEKLRALYQQIPSPNEIKQQIDKSRTANDALGKIKKRLEKIKGHKYRDEVRRAEACCLAFEQFCEQSKVDDTDTIDKLSHMYQGTAAFNEFFKPFIDAYSINYKKSEDKALNESHVFVFSPAKMREHLMQMMFESYIYEDDSNVSSKSNKNSSNKIDSKKLVSRCINFINKHSIFNYSISNENLMCMPKDDIKRKLRDFDISKMNSDFGEFQNGILICNKPNLLSESSLAEKDLKASIMSILFEEEKNKKQNKTDDEKSSDADNKKDEVDKKENKPIDTNKIYTALKSVLAEFNVTDVAEKIFTYELRSLDKDSEQKSNEEGEEDTTQFGLDDELNEAEKSNKKKKPPIDDSIVDKIQKNLVEAVRRVLKGGKKGPHQNPLVGFGEKKDVISFLSSHGFGDAGQYKKLKKRYAMIAYIKRPSDGPVLNLKTKKSTKRTGTIGQKNANASSMKTAFQSIADEFNGKIGDVIEFNGVPSNSKINSTLFTVDEDRPLFYNSSDVIANASVYCTDFDIDESSNPDPQPPPGHGPGSLNAKSNVAYVLPFGKDISVEIPNKEININTDVKEVSRNDLYIVPMPGLKYEDPEDANQNLK